MTISHGQCEYRESRLDTNTKTDRVEPSWLSLLSVSSHTAIAFTE